MTPATGIIPSLHDAPVRDRDGTPVGSVEDLLADAATNRPARVVVRLDDGRRTVVPAAGARPTLHGTRVIAGADVIATCPITLDGASLPAEHVVRACRHYGVPRPAGDWPREPFVAVRGATAAPPAPVPLAA